MPLDTRCDFGALQASAGGNCLRPWNSTERGLLEAASRWTHKSQLRRVLTYAHDIDSALLTMRPVRIDSPTGSFAVRSAAEQLLDDCVYGDQNQVTRARRRIVSLTAFTGCFLPATAQAVAHAIEIKFALPPYDARRPLGDMTVEIGRLYNACEARIGASAPPGPLRVQGVRHGQAPHGEVTSESEGGN